MLQTLFHIPLTYRGVPVFGFGWLLLAWAVAGAWVLGWVGWRRGFGELRAYLPLLAIVGLLIAFVLPRLCDDEGLAIRGYGVMLLAGVVSGVSLAAWRARRMGLDPEIIFSLAMWVFVAGIFGARLFYILQYWKEFQQPTLGETIWEMATFTKGGLVVFGSAIGAGFALVVFTRRHRLPGLALADLIAPSLMLGLALGRVGCFANGCCWGGACDWPWAVEFPFQSPPFVREVEEAQVYLHGLKFDHDPKRNPKAQAVIRSVEPGSAAERAGLRAGDEIVQVSGDGLQSPQVIKTFKDAEQVLLSIKGQGKRIELLTREAAAAARPIELTVSTASEHSLSIHPVQLYAAIDAGLLCLFLLAYYPYRRHDGEVFALAIAIHSFSRFVQEEIRTDESGIFGTSLSISQWISVGFMLAAVALMYRLSGQPRGSVWPPQAITLTRSASKVS